jgi:ketosteroid isomerase-like protein
MRRILAVLVVCFVGVSLFAQTPSAERQIRNLITKYDTDHDRSTIVEKDDVFWSGAYAKPQTASVPTDPADLLAAPGRKNEVQKTDVQRIVVAKADDMAYEYSTFTLSFDDDAGHKERKGALLRVWRQTGTEWKIAAMFQRPYGRVVPVDAATK